VILNRRWVDSFCLNGRNYIVRKVKLKGLPGTLSDLSSNVEHEAAAEDDYLVLKLDCSMALPTSYRIVSGSVGYILPYQFVEVNSASKDFCYGIISHASNHDG